jgi:hypothetical protein
MSPERAETGLLAVMDLLALNKRQARDLLDRSPEADSVLEHFDVIDRLLRGTPSVAAIQEARRHAHAGFARAKRVYLDNHHEGDRGRTCASVLSEPDGPRYRVQDVARLLRPHLATLGQNFMGEARKRKAREAVRGIVADVTAAGKGDMFGQTTPSLRHELGVKPYTLLREILDDAPVTA